MNPELAVRLLLVSTAALVVIFADFTDMANDVLLMVLMVTIFAIIIVSILVGIIFRQRMDAGKKAKGSGAWISWERYQIRCDRTPAAEQGLPVHNKQRIF